MTAFTVSGDKYADNKTSTWAELRLSIETLRGRQWIRLDHDATSRCDCYHLNADNARAMAATLNAMADELDAGRLL